MDGGVRPFPGAVMAAAVLAAAAATALGGAAVRTAAVRTGAVRAAGRSGSGLGTVRGGPAAGRGVPWTGVRSGVSIGTIEEDPEVTHEKWKRSAEEAYRRGVEARAAGRKADAVKWLRRAFDIGRRMRIRSPYPQKAADLLEELTREGLRELEVARDLVEGEAPAEGLAELRRITRTYLGLPPARLAGSLLRHLEKDPTFQARLRKARWAEQLKRAEALEAEAAALRGPLGAASTPEGGPGAPPGQPAAAPERASPAAPAAAPAGAAPPAASGPPASPGASAAPRERGGRAATPPANDPQAATPEAPDGGGGQEAASKEGGEGGGLSEAERRSRRLDLLARAYDLYRWVAEAAKDTEVGRRARAACRRLEADADLMARLRRHQAEAKARQWMELALNYMRAGRLDRAQALFRKVVTECPGTPQARQARDFLADLQK